MKKKNKHIRLLIIIGIGIGVFFFYYFFINLFFNKLLNSFLHKENYNFLNSLEDKSVDLFMKFRATIKDITFSNVYSQRSLSKNISKEFVIIGIDDKTLSTIGKWPFKRSIHSKIVDYFTNSEFRESLLFFDIFFLEKDNNPLEDKIFIESIKNNKKTILDYIAREKPYIDNNEKIEMLKRIDFIKKKFGLVNNIKGTFKKATTYTSLTPPTIQYMENISQVGLANLNEDSDKISRRYPLIYKFIDNEEMIFTDIKKEDLIDKIYLDGFAIAINKKINEYSLIKDESVIYDKTDINIAERKPLNENDIIQLKKNIQAIENNLKEKLNILKEKADKNNQLIVSKIIEFILNSKLPGDFKDQLTTKLKQKEYFNDIDLVLKETINFLGNVSGNQKKYENELKYLNKMYKKIIKFNRGEEDAKILENNKIEKNSLYDLIYKNKEVNLNRILIFKESFFITIPLAILITYFNVDINDVEVIFGKKIILKNPKILNNDTQKLEKLKINNIEQDTFKIPIDKSGNLLINYAGPPSTSNRDKKTTFNVYSYSDIYSGEQILVKNKIVMIGAFAEGVADDEYLTPFGTTYGIEIIANTINTILTKKFIIKFNNYLYLALLFIISILISLVSSNKKILFAYIYSILFIFLYYIFASFLFISINVVLEVPKVIIISLLSLMSVIVYRVLTEEKQKKEIKAVFSRFVNPNVVEELLESPPELGGVDKNITVLFSDIRNFTTLSEKLPPQKTINHLNKYFTAMTEIILKYNGTLDKYIGDEIMCFWGAPKPQDNHAELACKSALEQIKKLKELNKNWSESMKINIGIGINSGIMTVGNVGSEGRMNYTVIGDNVNLGARLEGVNKTFGTNIIISESTYLLIKDKFNVRELDTIKVKGKKKPVKIYELLEEKNNN